VRDSGVQLGWDDEQLLIWKNRQIQDPATETRQSPMVVRGYRVDVREAGDADWHSVMEVEADLSVGNTDIGHFEGELNVEVTPVQLENQEDGDFWTPAYFTQWQGRSLVTEDTVDLQLGGHTVSAGRYTSIGDQTSRSATATPTSSACACRTSRTAARRRARNRVQRRAGASRRVHFAGTCCRRCRASKARPPPDPIAPPAKLNYAAQLSYPPCSLARPSFGRLGR
jgi:hypothetical protein